MLQKLSIDSIGIEMGFSVDNVIHQNGHENIFDIFQESLTNVMHLLN